MCVAALDTLDFSDGVHTVDEGAAWVERMADGAVPGDGVRAVERAVDVLFSFTREPVLDMAALQASTGLSRPTLYRLLHTLEGKGLVYSFGTPRRFQLGFRFGL